MSSESEGAYYLYYKEMYRSKDLEKQVAEMAEQHQSAIVEIKAQHQREVAQLKESLRITIETQLMHASRADALLEEVRALKPQAEAMGSPFVNPRPDGRCVLDDIYDAALRSSAKYNGIPRTVVEQHFAAKIPKY